MVGRRLARGAHAVARAHLLRPGRADGDAETKVPVRWREYLARERVFPDRPSPGHAARGGAAADARECGQLIGGLLQPRRGAGRYRQRREAAGARGEAGGGGKIVAGGDARALADPGGIEERTGPARIFWVPVESERVRREIAQLHGSGGEQLVERDRK